MCRKYVNFISLYGSSGYCSGSCHERARAWIVSWPASRSTSVAAGLPGPASRSSMPAIPAVSDALESIFSLREGALLITLNKNVCSNT